MAKAYSSEVCRRLTAIADEQNRLRPRRVARHEAGDLLALDVVGVAPAWRGRATFQIERYVGGGFAGQVYRARVVGVEGDAARQALAPGGVYALKMFVPWSRFARGFRDALYALAFQAPFGLQVSRWAVRAAALWQKLIRRGAAVRFGRESAVVDVHATFFDPALGSMGQVLEWVEGRVWRLEVNERLFSKGASADGRAARAAAWTGTEYAAKKKFMLDVVALLHEMGAAELARQYEWWTMKSQPNVLKRRLAPGDSPLAPGDSPLAPGDSPGAKAAVGLVAVDFGPGLALLPFLPMSPGDVKLIFQGVANNRPVQFDRGDLGCLEAFVARHAAAFTDLGGAVAELRMAEAAYRRSRPDLAHHGLRLMTDRRRLASVLAGWARGYEARGVMDGASARAFARRPVRLGLFILFGLVPFFGKAFQRFWGSRAYRRHVLAMLASMDYAKRAVRARQAERLIEWHRRGRAGAERAEALVNRPVRFWLQAFTLALLPPGWHRFLTDRRYAWDVVRFVFFRPFVLYFSRAAREQWLRQMVEEGRSEGILSPAEADGVVSRIKEPYIQTYLLSMVVHLFTIPITQIVSFALGGYVAARYSVAWGAGIIVGAQFTPISPGSIVRGLYATGLALWKRDWKNYSWAVCISYWKYVGYLGFPIQMVHAYPVLARFVAGRWATRATARVPVFGERGALLEHGVFNLLFNVPISLRRRWSEREAERAKCRSAAGLVGTVFGIGHLPGASGTYASAVCAGLLLAAFYLGASVWAVGAAALVVAVVSIPLARRFEARLGRPDPGPFVLDEVAGMLVAGLAAWMPTSRWAWASMLLAFFWFRVCDILKPPPVRQAERLRGGWGVVADDVVAGAMALGLAVLSQVALSWLVG